MAPLKVEKGTDKLKVEAIESKKAVRLFIIFAVGMIFSGLMYRTYTVILPSFLEFRLGSFIDQFRGFFADRLSSVSENQAFETLVANLVATVIYVIGIGGQAIGGRIADRFSLKWSYFLY